VLACPALSCASSAYLSVIRTIRSPLPCIRRIAGDCLLLVYQLYAGVGTIKVDGLVSPRACSLLAEQEDNSDSDMCTKILARLRAYQITAEIADGTLFAPRTSSYSQSMFLPTIAPTLSILVPPSVRDHLTQLATGLLKSLGVVRHSCLESRRIHALSASGRVHNLRPVRAVCTPYSAYDQESEVLLLPTSVYNQRMLHRVCTPLLTAASNI
jgi:hypothetical protein